MRYTRFAAAAWLFVLGFSLAPAGAAASDNESFRLDADTPIIETEPVSRGEEPPNYWKNWTKESTFARDMGPNRRGRNGEATATLEQSEAGMVRPEENQAKELTLGDVGMGTLKVVSTIVLAPIVVTGYVGFFILEAVVRGGGSYGFG